jgi:copper oxidase (laccase) domain-containing protein
MLDLNLANADVLLQSGIKEQNIHISGECTFCKSDLYYSHRATKGKRGNLAAMIEL